MFPKAVKQSKAGLRISVHFFNKGQMFPAPAALGKLVSSGKGPCFDGYARPSGCGTAQLITAAGSTTLAGALRLNWNRYANGGNAGWTRRLRGESHSRSQCSSFAARSKGMPAWRESAIRCERLPLKGSSSRVNIYSVRGMKQYLQLCNFSTIAAEETVDQWTQACLCSPPGGGFPLDNLSQVVRGGHWTTLSPFSPLIPTWTWATAKLEAVVCLSFNVLPERRFYFLSRNSIFSPLFTFSLLRLMLCWTFRKGNKNKVVLEGGANTGWGHCHQSGISQVPIVTPQCFAKYSKLNDLRRDLLFYLEWKEKIEAKSIIR